MKKILVVDDDVRLLDVTRKALEATGAYELMTADSGRRALTAAATFKPDLVILDIMMPGMDGGEVASALLRHPATRDVPVLFLTSLATRVEKINAGGGKRSIGRYLAKPVDLQELCCRVAELLNSDVGPVSDAVPGLADTSAVTDRGYSVAKDVTRAADVSGQVLSQPLPIMGPQCKNRSIE